MYYNQIIISININKRHITTSKQVNSTEMLYDLVVILLIIGFSFIFKISITKNYDQQLIFILLALVVMAVYKYMTYRHMTRMANKMPAREPYQDFADEINDFLGQEIPNGINQGNINEYKSQLATLQDKVDIMNEYLKDLNSRATMDSQNQAAIGGLDFQAGQQIQDYRIKQIQQDIQRTADLIKQSRLDEDAKKYNKIKVFSSCVVSNADGSYSSDTPSNIISSSGSSVIGTGGYTNQVAGMTSGGSSSIGNVAPAGATGSQSIGAGSGVNINSVLEAIAKNGVDIKLN